MLKRIKDTNVILFQNENINKLCTICKEEINGGTSLLIYNKGDSIWLHYNCTQELEKQVQNNYLNKIKHTSFKPSIIKCPLCTNTMEGDRKIVRINGDYIESNDGIYMHLECAKSISNILEKDSSLKMEVISGAI
jgi:hypothetical protein